MTNFLAPDAARTFARPFYLLRTTVRKQPEFAGLKLDFMLEHTARRMQGRPRKRSLRRLQRRPRRRQPPNHNRTRGEVAPNPGI
jgi:hypothetical protein